MKLIRFGDPGNEKPGLQLADDRRIDASGFGQDYDEAFWGGGRPGSIGCLGRE